MRKGRQHSSGRTGKPRSSEDDSAEIYTTYVGRIYNFVYRMTYSEEAAEDITQETFVKVLENYSTFRGDCSVSTWIYAIAKNLCLQHLKKAGKRTFQSIEELIEKVSAPVGKGQYDEYERHWYINQVKDGCLLGLLRCLSFYQRIAFILNVLNEVPIKDISRIIGKSENSCRILIYRARASIKSFLCRNCSLFEGTNRCRCENLISFSLKQEWIKAYSPGVTPETIESELKAFKDELLLYRTLPDRAESDGLARKISSILEQDPRSIFSRKKVK